MRLKLAEGTTAIVVQQVAMTLSERLMQLRVQQWPRVVVTQRQLAHALGVSTALISSWEKGTKPPLRRLADYAQFFATRRSVETAPFQLIEELKPDEVKARDALLSELTRLRDTTPRSATSRSASAADPLGGPWAFDDTNDVSLICAEVPQAELDLLAGPEDPNRPYAELYSFADIDAAVELYGHVRAANPHSKVALQKIHSRNRLHGDDLTRHLVMLGGGDWNTLTDNAMAEVPVQQISDPDDPAQSRFEVSDGDETLRYTASFDTSGSLVEDVGLFFRAPSPYNPRRTLTICYAMYSKGTFGVVRALTDERFRDRNEAFLQRKFGDAPSFALLTRIRFVGNAVITPDWTLDDTILYAWPTPSGKETT